MAYAPYVKLNREFMNLRARKKAETSARLVQVARRSFYERGYADTAMDELCAEAGLTRGALYHNFGGKEGLFEAVVRQIDHEIGERLLEVAGETVTLESFTRTCIAYLEMAIDPEIQRIVFQDGPSVLGQRLREIDQEGSIEPLKQAITELQDMGSMIDADTTALAILINGAMIDAALWIATGEDADRRFELASDSLAKLVEGLST